MLIYSLSIFLLGHFRRLLALVSVLLLVALLRWLECILYNVFPLLPSFPVSLFVLPSYKQVYYFMRHVSVTFFVLRQIFYHCG
ncbi:hypothetical protein V1523DRAFT_156339 [Lipomyces doorenjongii]